MMNVALLQAQGANPFSTIIMIVIMFALFYFTFIRPQQKKQKEIKTFRAGLSVNSKVVTSGGVYGTIKELNDQWVMLEVAQGVKIKVDINSIYPSVDSGIIENK